MVADDRLTRITGMIRAMGILVLFTAALVGMPQPASAGGECWSYFIEQCVNEQECELDDGEPCGEAIPGCAGEGTIECREGALCGEGEVNKVCNMEGAT